MLLGLSLRGIFHKPTFKERVVNIFVGLELRRYSPSSIFDAVLFEVLFAPFDIFILPSSIFMLPFLALLMLLVFLHLMIIHSIYSIIVSRETR